MMLEKLFFGTQLTEYTDHFPKTANILYTVGKQPLGVPLFIGSLILYTIHCFGYGSPVINRYINVATQYTMNQNVK